MTILDVQSESAPRGAVETIAGSGAVGLHEQPVLCPECPLGLPGFVGLVWLTGRDLPDLGTLVRNGRLHTALGGDGVPAGSVRRRLGRRADRAAPSRAAVRRHVGDVRRRARPGLDAGDRLLPRRAFLRRGGERGDAAGNGPGPAAALSRTLLPGAHPVFRLSRGDRTASGSAALGVAVAGLCSASRPLPDSYF